MAWLMLTAAGLLEVVWAYAMKLSDGFTRPLYSIVTLVGMIASFALLSAAMLLITTGHGIYHLDRDRGSRLICCRPVFSGGTCHTDAHIRCGGDCSRPYYDETGILRYVLCQDGATCPGRRVIIIIFLTRHIYVRFSLIADRHLSGKINSDASRVLNSEVHQLAG